VEAAEQAAAERLAKLEAAADLAAERVRLLEQKAVQLERKL
jgi:hypothetical protein